MRAPSAERGSTRSAATLDAALAVREAGFAPIRTWLLNVEAYWSAQLAAFNVHAEGCAVAERKRRR